METRLSYGAEAKNNELVTSMYYQDVDQMDVHGATVSTKPRKIKVQYLVSIGQSLVKVLNVMVEFMVKFWNKKKCS